jgi:hypothetical protein
MNDDFFGKPILNSPYEYPSRHWELDAQGQPTQQIIGTRRRAQFITPIPKPKKQKGKPEQATLLYGEGKESLDRRAAVRAHRAHQLRPRRSGQVAEVSATSTEAPGRGHVRPALWRGAESQRVLSPCHSSRRVRAGEGQRATSSWRRPPMTTLIGNTPPHRCASRSTAGGESPDGASRREPLDMAFSPHAALHMQATTVKVKCVLEDPDASSAARQLSA